MTKEEQELEILKEYKELYKKYEQNSICLNKENFEKSNRFIFIYDDIWISETTTLLPILQTFKFENKHAVGSIFDYFRFKWRIRVIETLIEKYIDINIFEYPNLVKQKGIAEISSREIKIMKKRFVIKLKSIIKPIDL